MLSISQVKINKSISVSSGLLEIQQNQLCSILYKLFLSLKHMQGLISRHKYLVITEHNLSRLKVIPKPENMQVIQCF